MMNMKIAGSKLRQLLIASAISAIVVWMLALPALAADDDQALARKLHAAGQILALEKIAARAHAEKPGEILETELENEQGRYIYEVEILDSAGQVWELKLDAKTADLLQMERDD